MFTQRELDEIQTEAEAEFAEIMAEFEEEFLGERANYMMPEEVEDGGEEEEYLESEGES